MTWMPVPPLFPLGSLGAAPSPQRQPRRRLLGDQAEKDGETLVMDIPVVVGELRDEGAEMGVGR